MGCRSFFGFGHKVRMAIVRRGRRHGGVKASHDCCVLASPQTPILPSALFHSWHACPPGREWRRAAAPEEGPLPLSDVVHDAVQAVGALRPVHTGEAVGGGGALLACSAGRRSTHCTKGQCCTLCWRSIARPSHRMRGSSFTFFHRRGAHLGPEQAGPHRRQSLYAPTHERLHPRNLHGVRGVRRRGPDVLRQQQLHQRQLQGRHLPDQRPVGLPLQHRWLLRRGAHVQSHGGSREDLPELGVGRTRVRLQLLRRHLLFVARRAAALRRGPGDSDAGVHALHALRLRRSGRGLRPRPDDEPRARLRRPQLQTELGPAQAPP